MPLFYNYLFYTQSTTAPTGGVLFPLSIFPLRAFGVLNLPARASIQTAVSAVASEGAEPTGQTRTIPTGVVGLTTDL